MRQALVIGGGPAGLMAADELAGAGLRVVLAEKMPTLGRKFLMAGKSGLNLTKVEAPEAFLAAFGEAAPQLKPMIDRFGPKEVQRWAESLGAHLFTGTTGRVFPEEMKASPLLRAWIRQLSDRGVDMRVRWAWRGWEKGAALFDTPEGRQEIRADVTVLAMGGASWPRLGSDGGWTGAVGHVAPFAPANCGFRVGWSRHMAPHFGAPIKAVALRAGGQESRGEFVLSREGVEGGAIYALSRVLREGALLRLDLLPDLEAEEIAARLARAKRGESMANRLRKALHLDPAKRALLQEFARPLPEEPGALSKVIKSLEVPLGGPQGIDRAISTAGGLRMDAMDAHLMLRDRPGVFAAGEMLDWEAPTGGYLLTACMATGKWAGFHAARWS